MPCSASAMPSSTARRRSCASTASARRSGHAQLRCWRCWSTSACAPVSKHELLDTVWRGVVVEENNLQVQISTLRRLLLTPQAIATIPGRGYRFMLPLEGEASDRVPDGRHAARDRRLRGARQPACAPARDLWPQRRVRSGAGDGRTACAGVDRWRRRHRHEHVLHWRWRARWRHQHPMAFG